MDNKITDKKLLELIGTDFEFLDDSTIDRAFGVMSGSAIARAFGV